MPNKRISELDLSSSLHFGDGCFNESYIDPTGTGQTEDWFLMTAKPKLRNERISFLNFHRSVLVDSMYLNENQIISGQKIFADKCFITKKLNVHSVQDPTPSGDISGYGFVGKTGSFGNIIAGTGDPTAEVLSIYGDALFENNLIIGGTIVFPGLFQSTGDFSSLNLSVSGEVKIEQGMSVTGDESIFSNTQITGNLESEQLSGLGDLYIGQTIFAAQDSSINFEDNKINFLNSQQNYINVNETGLDIKDVIKISGDNFVNISNETPSGDIYIRGDCYSEEVFSSNKGLFQKFYAEDDESMVFKSQLISGEREFVISLPKTFHCEPVISVNLQHISGLYIIPYLISESTTYEFKIKFGENIEDNNFSLHSTVMAPSSGDFSSNKNGFQRFKTTLPSGSSMHQISFPNPHQVNPTVSVCLEGDSEIIPYTISGVNKDNYHIIMGAETSEEYIIHTISTEEYSQLTS